MHPLVYDLDLPALTALLASWGEPAYRASQVWQGLYHQFWNTPDEFTNLPKSLRARLGEELRFAALTPVTYLDSSDGQTRKTLFQLHDGRLIEAVLMRYGDPASPPSDSPPKFPEFGGSRRGVDSSSKFPEFGGSRRGARRTLCISTQSGCAMGCAFCATGQMGFKRHLTSGEIVAQVMYYACMLEERGERVTNIVVMGMGEPFHNYDNTMAAIDRLNDPDGYNFGARRITLSTVGLVPMMRRFANEKRQVNLAVSLHAIHDDARSSLMPVNKKYNLAELLDACRYYVEKTGRRITFEWALIHGVNDSPEIARQLAARLRGLLCHVNVIPLNPTAGYNGKATDRQRAEAFKEALEQAGVACTIRLRRGIDIQAGCGQLAGNEGFQGDAR
ncbi:MAG: 23S rRNA (adenine(2503)-C(2))-methyltransferase RlmN [Chloroflexota bacterium]